MSSLPMIQTGERERAQALLEMGFDETQTVLLATSGPQGPRVDIDYVRDLLRAGCEHEVALRIVL